MAARESSTTSYTTASKHHRHVQQLHRTTIPPGFANNVPTSPVTTYWHSQKMKLTHSMLSTILGYALIIHKLQGNTSDRLILNVGENEFAAVLLLVGCMWTKTFQGLSFLPFPINYYEHFPSHQCSSEERRIRRDSNRLSTRPLTNIAMQIRWITKSSQFRTSIHVRRMKTHFHVRTITILDFIIQIARW